MGPASRWFKYLVYLCLGIVCLFGSVRAQSTDAKDRFRCLVWTGVVSDVFLTQSDLPVPTPDNPNPTPAPDYKDQRISITCAFRSPFYYYNRSKPVEFVKHDGAKIVLVAKVDLSTAPQLPLLFFRPGKSAGTYDIQIIDDNESDFPGGSSLVFNYSGITSTIAFQNSTGTVSATLTAGKSQLLKPNFEPFTTTFVTLNIPGANSVVYSGAWSLRKDVRFLIFIVNDPKRPGSVIFLRVLDNLRELVTPTPQPGQ